MPWISDAVIQQSRIVLARLGTAIAILLAFWLVAAIANRVICRFGPRVPGNKELVQMLGVLRMRLCSFSVW